MQWLLLFDVGKAMVARLRGKVACSEAQRKGLHTGSTSTVCGVSHILQGAEASYTAMQFIPHAH